MFIVLTLAFPDLLQAQYIGGNSKGYLSVLKLVVFNMFGSEIETLVNETQSVGTYEATFNASQLPSGIYFARFEAGTYNNIIKMLMLK
ncbi:MAG: T9SS type A sorting domain-containing protein [Ignavibacteriae bacterium]|nr:T9SS type A sorting domain-containing protein [Ignavibacteriota bacterium]